MYAAKTAANTVEHAVEEGVLGADLGTNSKASDLADSNLEVDALYVNNLNTAAYGADEDIIVADVSDDDSSVDEFDLSDITARDKTREEVIAAAEAAAFDEANKA